MSIRPIPYIQEYSRQTMPNAPAFDPTQLTKTWLDENPTSDPMTYTVLNPDYTFGKLMIPATVAKSVNIPGHPDYPHFDPIPSGAKFNGTIFPVSDISEAKATAAEVGADPELVFDEMAGISGFDISYPEGDDRRAWGVKLPNGVTIQATLLIQQKNANGVGAPGKWVQDGSGVPKWVSTLAAPDATSMKMPVPLGPFAAGSKIIFTGPAGMGPMLQEPDPPAPPAVIPGSASCGFTAEDHAIIQRLGTYFK